MNTGIRTTEDIVTWSKEKNECYSVTSGYTLAFQFYHAPVEFFPEQCRRREVWSSIWKLKCQPKIKIFLWKVMHEGLPVKERLHSRIQMVNPICNRCDATVESILHCLTQCPESENAWKIASLPWTNQETETWRWWLWLQEQLKERRQMQKETHLAAILTWQIWKMRNLRIFEAKVISPQEVVAIARSGTLEAVTHLH
ncbi:hypothetical protein AHAS_Ahas12G0164600 [Arachis hypogaea]